MTISSRVEKAVRATEANHWLLIFPIPGKSEPKSVWHALYPKSVMRWNWDESADERVVQLWHLRRSLAESHRVIYSKWFQGRATIFSKTAFKKLWVYFASRRERLVGESREILELLEMESPLSTKQIRKMSDLTGKENEKRYVAAMKELWRTFAIVGIGEIDDGAFPSLAHAATSTVFEELCREAESEETFQTAKEWLEENFPEKQFQRQLKL